MDMKVFLEIISKNTSNLYLYHYTKKENAGLIKKYGLLSLYGMYKKEPKLYEEAIDNYRERIVSFTGKKSFTIEDASSFFESRNLSIKDVFFSFWKIIPGLNKDRDEFIRNAIEVKLPINSLRSDWAYMLITGSKINKINKNIVLDFTKLDSTKFQKQKGGKFLFSKIPHVAIRNNEGIIPKEMLSISGDSK